MAFNRFMSKTVTFKRIGLGEFESYLNGVLTPWKIYNGSLGLSGRDTANHYGISRNHGESVKWLGPLRTCKFMVTDILSRDADLKPAHATCSFQQRVATTSPKAGK
jgi:hypothetical protein